MGGDARALVPSSAGDTRGTEGRGTAERITPPPRSDHDRRVTFLVERLERVSRIRLTDFFAKWPGSSWAMNTVGMRFRSTRTAELRAALMSSGHFVLTGRPNAPTQRFREVNPDPAGGSLHFLIAADDDCCHEIHFDSVSIVRGKDPRTGTPIYSRSLPTLMEHYAVDKLGLRQDKVVFPW